jgi:Domain of unknown function (DUF1707)
VTFTPSDGLPGRSSDDRETAVQRIQDAYAVGQISYEDMDGRLHTALLARSTAELVAAVDALPTSDEGRTVRIAATRGRVRRSGAWRVPRFLSVELDYGRLDLDFSQAVFESAVVDLDLQLRFGKALLTVPPNAVVDLDELRCEWKQPNHKPPVAAGSGGPLIRVCGAMEFGRLTVKHKRR